MERQDYREIICPFCFAKFREDEAIFRATAGYEQEVQRKTQQRRGGGNMFNVEDSETEENEGGEDRTRILFRKFDTPTENEWRMNREELRRHCETSNRKLDIPLIEFWRERGHGGGYEKNDPDWNMPHIDPKSPAFNEMILTDPGQVGKYAKKIDGNGFVRDEDGFILRVVDRLGGAGNPMKRLCPHCHNSLPLADYGKYDTVFISIVGRTGTGKTVYLNQLFTELGKALLDTGYVLGMHNLAQEIGASISPRAPLPAATDDQLVRRPLAADLQRAQKDGRSGMTLVFYDIAGENCEIVPGAANYAEKAKRLLTINTFIQQCDGLIFLVAPDEIPAYQDASVIQYAERSDIAAIISTINDVRGGNPESPTWEKVPVAITVAKSDCIDPENEMTDALFFQDTGKSAGFNRNEFLKIDSVLRGRVFDSSQAPAFAGLNVFPDRGFFMVSAITCGVESRFEKFQNIYILDEENEAKFKNLKKWIVGWNKRTEEERAYFAPCPVAMQKDGAEFFFMNDQPVDRKSAEGVAVDIVSYPQEGPEYWLTLADVLSIGLEGYAKGNPSPRRIADPVKWILWKRENIVPYYISDEPEPTKKFLESTRSFNNRHADWEQRENYNKEHFYRVFGEEQA